MTPKTVGILLLGAAALASCSSSSNGKKILAGVQTGTVTITLADGKVSFGQPKQIKVSGTAVYDDPTDTVTLSLTIKNGSKSVLHNAKVLVTGLSEGTLTADGTFGPSPGEGSSPGYIYYGPESIPPGGTAARDIEFTGVTGVGTELTMDVEVLVHPWAFLPGNSSGVYAVDISGSGEELDLFTAGEINDFGYDSDCWARCDAMSPDTRFVYFTNRNQPAILMFDTVDQTLTIGDSYLGGTIAFDASGDVGCFDGLTTSPDGNHLYGTLSHTAHISTFTSPNWPVPTEIEVLKINAKTLKVEKRVTIWTPPVPGPGGEGADLDIRGREVSTTLDGQFGAVSITGASEVVMLDLGSMSVMDTFATSGLDPRYAAISPDASAIVVAYTYRDSSDGTLEVIDTATGDLDTLVPDTLDVGTDTQGAFLRVGPDGRLYYGRCWNTSVPGVSVYDPVLETWTEFGGYGMAIHFGTDRWCYWDYDNGELHCYGYDDVELTFPATGALGLTPTVGSWGHGMVVTE
jgi:hypothetical protein